MQYLALLVSKERDLTPDQRATEMAAYQSFHAKAGPAIRAGDALLPAATAVRIAGGADAPTITDGPFAEAAEVAGGYYVFEAENLDEALELARGIPAARYGAIEVRPIYHTVDPEWSRSDGQWLALLLEPPAAVNTPGTPAFGPMLPRQVSIFVSAFGGIAAALGRWSARQFMTQSGHRAGSASEAGCVPFLTRRPVAKWYASGEEGAWPYLKC